MISRRRYIQYLQTLYDTFTIKTKDKVRLIQEPRPLLKDLQRSILATVDDNFNVSRYATAKEGSSHLANGKRHQGAIQLILLDIENFFPSLNKDNFPDTYIDPLIKRILFLPDGSVPTGAPTSILLSNYLLYNFDHTLGKFIKFDHAFCGYELRFTRYVDDITISTSTKKLPKNLVVTLIEKIEAELSIFKLQLNESKTRIVYPKTHQKFSVTGVSLQGKSLAPRKIRRLLRSVSYKRAMTDTEWTDQECGLLSYLESIDPKAARKIRDESELLIDKVRNQ